MQLKGTLPLDRIPADRTPSLELVRITEAAAIAAAHWMGHGNNNEADQAAVEAMRKTMEDARFNGMIVIGEGERDEAPMLFIGERVGRGDRGGLGDADKLEARRAIRRHAVERQCPLELHRRRNASA